MTKIRVRHSSACLIAALALGALVTLVPGCGGGSKPKTVTMGTAPVGGAFAPVGKAISDTLNEHKGDNNWRVRAIGTDGSQDNIRKLDKGEIEIALSNSAISYCAVRGEAEWKKKHDIRTIVTIAPNVAMFITKKDSGIKSIADLKGKRVVCGPAGAGFEMFLEPLLAAHGVSFEDFGDKLNNNQNGSVDMLADGSADAAFLGGAVPTAAVQRACNEMDVYFVPFDPMAVEQLLKDYPFYQQVTIAADKYSDLTEDFAGLNVGSMHLITSADADEDLVYQMTKTIWEHRAEIDHPAAKAIREGNANRYTGTDFHPGAQKFYDELWPPETEGGEKTGEDDASDEGDESDDDTSNDEDSSSDESTDDAS